MPFEVPVVETKSNILGRLMGMLKTQKDLILRLSGTIIPTLDCWFLAGEQLFQTATLNLNVAAGNMITGHTVPDGWIWILRGGVRDDTTASSYVMVNCLIEGVATGRRLTGSGTSAANFDGYNLILRPGDTLGMISTANAGDGARLLTVYGIKYPVR